MQKFETGRTYSTRSICDSECIYRVTVMKRTEKSVWISEYNGEPKRKAIFIDFDGNEAIYPHGRHSMCAVISADRADAA